MSPPRTDRWLRLDGTANTRDLGGLPTTDGGTTAPGRILRSDNLQTLSDGDVRRLVGELRLRQVVDLRTTVVPDAGHDVHLDQPEVTARLVLGFLSGG